MVALGSDPVPQEEVLILFPLLRNIPFLILIGKILRYRQSFCNRDPKIQWLKYSRILFFFFVQV